MSQASPKMWPFRLYRSIPFIVCKRLTPLVSRTSGSEWTIFGGRELVPSPLGSLETTIAHLRTADSAKRSEADQAGYNEVNGDEVIEEAWKNQDQNPRDERYEGREMGVHGHHHGLVLLDEIVRGCAAVHHRGDTGVGLEPMPASGR